MKKVILKFVALVLAVSLVLGTCAAGAYAEDDKAEDASDPTATSISLSPVSNVLQISSNSTYNHEFEVKNDGESPMEIEVYAAPYSYVYSEDDDAYKLGFSKENNFTQISRWITFKDSGGSWVKKATFKIEPKKTLKIEYKIATPDDIPAGGQYAVIFAHTLSSTTTASGIRTEASPGLIVYGRSTEGETKVLAEISDLKIEESVTENGNTRNNFFASAKVKNNGNVDFSAVGNLKVEPVFGGASYETPNNRARVSIIPEAELVVSDEWEESPSFGIYKVTWTVTAGEESQTIEKVVFVNPLPVIIIAIILLTIVIVWIIITVRKRKERRSRLAV